MQIAVKNRFLTKTRFKLAVECPTKLYYTGKPGIYADNSLEDDFLKALAEGGFQVGEIAKLMFPGGHDIKSLDHATAVEETNQLLVQDNVTLYEAAIRHGDLFIRVDVLNKKGNQIELIEVKAKSFNSKDIDTFSGKKGGIKKDMLPYLQDVAFQKYVASQAFPHWTISSFLMMADKSKTATVDGLNQRFKIRRDSKGRSSVTVMLGTTEANIGGPILSRVNVDTYIDQILQHVVAPGLGATLEKVARQWGEDYRLDRKIAPYVGAHCAKCEFRTTPAPPKLLAQRVS